MDDDQLTLFIWVLQGTDKRPYGTHVLEYATTMVVAHSVEQAQQLVIEKTGVAAELLQEGTLVEVPPFNPVQCYSEARLYENAVVTIPPFST